MLYIRLLPLLLLLVHPLYIRGVKGEDDLKSRVEDLTSLVQSLNDTVNSQGETIQKLRKSLDERHSEDECSFLLICITKNLTMQEEKIDEALNDLKVNGSTASKPRNCAEIEGGRASGVHQIYPNDKHTVSARCEKSDGGGWTVIQKRFDGSIDFFRGWQMYAEGFGNPAGEYWLGLHNIHALTEDKLMELYVKVIDINGGFHYAKYSSFSVSSEEDEFRLNIAGYSGNAGDGLTYHNGARFSTKDRNNDSYRGQCSHLYQGAWWYKACHYSNLNGLFTAFHVMNDAKYMSWRGLHNKFQAMKASVMMIRPVNFTPTV